MNILRRIGAVIVGVIVAFLIVAGVEGIAHKIYPPPPGTNMQDMAQVKAFVATLPLSVLLIVLAGWLLGTFVATWLAARIAGTPIPGYVVGAVLLCAGIANAFIIPQPLWFSIASFVIYIGATWVGARAGAPARVA
jgi:pimeloyl-ACP methyl ester carboxylesterase